MIGDRNGRPNGHPMFRLGQLAMRMGAVLVSPALLAVVWSVNTPASLEIAGDFVWTAVIVTLGGLLVQVVAPFEPRR